MSKLHFLFLLCFTLTFTSCKKWQHQYPEDTERTKDTPMERLTNKWWVLQKVTLNGQDFTDSVHNIHGVYKIYFSENLFATSTDGLEHFYGTISSDIGPAFVSVWTLHSKESNLAIGPLIAAAPIEFAFIPGYLNNGSFNQFDYFILKLNASELKISINTLNNDTTINNYFIKE